MVKTANTIPAPAEDRIFASVAAALGRAQRYDEPYRHWHIEKLLPHDVMQDLASLEFPIASVGDLSGKREFHNDTRHYIDKQNIANFDCTAALARAFHAPRMVQVMEGFFKTEIEGTFLRIEYAQDTTGFWLEPHTDLGVKRLTMLIYLPNGADQDDLGTDIYNPDKTHAKRAPFTPNSAMAFVPGNNTYHGFEERKINGIRKSLILNYVTTDWRDREQLCFPESTVTR
ncbi:hypothetical protein PUV54_00945 [Hyphococcus flavus]|uniref:2OG-Fe(II) oxygenase n=1 Tax=Hyphococcus flavus TaxID=1866326 RepID=A0AAF0CES2_9PROT|nr:hypothetical protein [Hyphococcus flavus]WDI31751.1 hypothetical protein PUV54_00945 [Hyphococcus flavus]